MPKVFLDDTFILRLILVAMTKDGSYDFGNLSTLRPQGSQFFEINNNAGLTYFTVVIQASLVDETPAIIFMRPINMKAEELLRISEIASEIFGNRAKITLTM